MKKLVLLATDTQIILANIFFWGAVIVSAVVGIIIFFLKNRKTKKM